MQQTTDKEVNAFTGGDWYIGGHNTIRAHIEGKESWEDQVICIYAGHNEANAELITIAPKLKAENEKLRDALKNIIDEMPPTTRMRITTKIKEIATEALNQTK